jgi:parallel beta-helix repeat protein
MNRFFGGSRLPWIRSWWRRLRFGDIVLLSLLPLLAAAYLLLSAAGEHRQARQFDDWWSRSRTVPLTFASRLGWMKRFPEALLVDRRFDTETDDPAVLHLLVPRSEWDDVMADPATGFGQWVEGLVDDAGRLDQVRVRKRGDTSVHWTTPKVSFTVRTRKSSLYRGHRAMAFSGRDVVTTYAANALTREFDLLAPDTWLAPVFLNRRFYGLFRGLELTDESFLRRHGRMPGTIYRGDAAERGEYYKGLPRNLFANPAIWEYLTVNDRPGAAPADAMAALVSDLNGGTFASHQRVLARVDPEEVARLMALLLLVGDPYHMDDVHNQLWYEDPATAVLHPIPWDLRLLDLGQPTMRLNTFFREMLRNPSVVEWVTTILAEWVQEDRFVQLADSITADLSARFADYLRFDGLRAGVIPPIGTPSDVSRLARVNSALLRTWLDDATVAFGTGGSDTLVLDFETRGYAGADLTAIGLGEEPGRPMLWRDSNRNGVLDEADQPVSGAIEVDAGRPRFVPDAPEPLRAGWDTGQPGIRPGRLHYRFFLTGVPGVQVEAALVNRVSGAVVTPVAWEAGDPIMAAFSWHPWQFQAAQPTTRRWSGNIHLRGTVRLAAGDTLVIAPGTTIRLDPDVSIVLRGPLHAVGTATRPIQFLPADQRLPWGALALQGPLAGGSRLAHVAFRGGGGALVDRIEYIGMVNVHRAADVEFRQVEFADNVRSDDTFHALHAEVHVVDSRFRNTNGDAVDYDYSVGTIADNTFEDSGGDGIDLMASSPWIHGNHVARSFDKGISVGERSSATINDNVLVDGDIGIEIKDASEPAITGNRLEHNRVAIKVSRKNWRYGTGGWAKLHDNILEANGVDVELDDRSRVTRGQPPAGGAQWWARYQADFDSPRGGWVSGGSARSLRKRDDALVLAARPGVATMTLSVDWEVEDPPGQLVLELGAHALDAVSIVLEGEGTELEVPVAVIDDSTEFRFVHVDVPPGRYRSLTLTATPTAADRVQRTTGLLTRTNGLLRLRRMLWYPDRGEGLWDPFAPPASRRP